MSAVLARFRPRSGVQLSQEQVVLLVVVALFMVFSFVLDGFLSVNNLLNLARSVSALGILSVGMAVVVIARGMDLSIVASMGVATAISIQLMQTQASTPVALLVGLGVVLLMGVFNGFLIAFVEIPALFATLASGLLVYGLARTTVLDGLIAELPGDRTFVRWLGQGAVLGIPVPILVFLVVAVLAQFMLGRMRTGRFIYAHGDNAGAAALTGVSVRPYTTIEYMLSAAIGFVGGLVVAGSVGGLNTQVIDGSLVYDVLLVVVVGGISLVGGRGSVLSVVVGTALIGVMLNGMTILNMNTHEKDIVKGLILLSALVLDNRLHPRDEETVRQGD
ncbi:ABC transporter permease [Prauserella muralis]|uniref:ABC transporter permease n=1 Tax=Prauserella muralis TaxID=588067 RepID=A0A2V4B1J5_9PSEU|nr:ABC transporter permease [Prauserella muralis]PXY27862.1 ABC transporter permease [Prauserella muralis]TWE22369.1 monosaccharide ABC transporter membrane protein (CUT2 family) [Prauserella muralis]